MIDTAIILAGGKGSRLMPWPAPKCLLPINGVPILSRLVRHLDNFKIGKIIICTGYRSIDIEAFVKRTLIKPVLLSHTEETAAMCERLLKADSDFSIKNGKTLICYGDELADVNINDLEDSHIKSGNKATCTTFKQKLSFGIIKDGRIVDSEFVLINIGFLLVENECWNIIEKKKDLATWVNDTVDKFGEINYYEHKGKRATVNDVAELQRAEEVWK